MVACYCTTNVSCNCSTGTSVSSYGTSYTGCYMTGIDYYPPEYKQKVSDCRPWPNTKKKEWKI